MRYVYVDESGNAAPFQSSESFLAVATVAASLAITRALELHIRRLKKKMGAGKGGEYKASEATPKQSMRLLEAIAMEDIGIVAVVIDKRRVLSEPKDPEEWYRQAVSQAIWRCAQRWPHLQVALDRRYTNLALRQRLEAAIKATLGNLAEGVTIAHLDSRLTPGLQIADYVAWAIRRKYEKSDPAFYDVIKARIVAEDVIEVK